MLPGTTGALVGVEYDECGVTGCSSGHWDEPAVLQVVGGGEAGLAGPDHHDINSLHVCCNRVACLGIPSSLVKCRPE